MVSFRGIHHSGLVVDDLDAAIAFYGDLLDMTEIERDDWRA
ncbi:MAG: VOC family protein, partial [Acidimicrobiia bacterium]|nr:VOC family protein [Acidimicrobiia bacterium]